MTPEQFNAQFAEMVGRVDSKVRCQCPHACGEMATVILESHVLGACNGPEANALGNRIDLLCTPCAKQMWAAAQRLAAAWRQAAIQVGGCPKCTSCGSPIWYASDIVRSVTRRDDGIQ